MSFAEPTPPQTPPAEEPPLAEIDWEAAAEWGRRQNIRAEGYASRAQHLWAINEVRRALGLPRYRIIRPVSPPGPLPAAWLTV